MASMVMGTHKKNSKKGKGSAGGHHKCRMEWGMRRDIFLSSHFLSMEIVCSPTGRSAAADNEFGAF